MRFGRHPHPFFPGEGLRVVRYVGKEHRLICRRIKGLNLGLFTVSIVRMRTLFDSRYMKGEEESDQDRHA